MSGGGFDLTDVLDFNAFLIDGGNGEWVLFDAGAGRSPNDANAILAADGIDPAAIRHLFLTHCHADHSGGARGVARSARPRRLCWAGDNADGRRRRRGGDQSRASSPGGCLSARLPLSCLSGGPRPRRRRGNDNRPPENQDDRDPGALRRPCFLSGRERWRRLLIAGDALFHGGRAPCRTSRTAASPTSAQRCESLPPLSSMHSCPAT